MGFVRNMLVAAIAGLATAATAGAAPIYFDFGSATATTPGNYNNVTAAAGVISTVVNAVDSTGAATGIGLITTGFRELGGNLNGTTTPSGDAAIFPSTATQDSLFGYESNFDTSGPRTPGLLEFTGLDPGMAYDFTFFASRTGVTNNREAEYSVSGSNGGVAYLDASNNTSNVAIVSGILPTAGGAITVTVQKGPNNNQTPDHFFYIGALCVECIVPEPSTLGLLAMAGMGLVSSRRFLL